MKRWVWLALILLPLGCQRTPKTPEDTFKMFSLAAGMGQPPGMERYGETTYAKELQSRYDMLALMSAVWPKEVMVVKSTTKDGVVTLDVQGTNAIGKTVQGTFQLRQHGDVWKVFEGDWKNLSGQELEAPAGETAPAASTSEFQPAVEVESGD
jgi:hypothetical protein